MANIPAYQIRSFAQENINDPQKLYAMARQFGLTANDIASATGYSVADIGNYLQSAGIDPARLDQAVPDAQIADFVRLNANDPQAMMDMAKSYGITVDDVARATGLDVQAINGYLAQNGMSGPVTASQINTFTRDNLNNPQLLVDMAAQYGLSNQDVADATGFTNEQITGYLQQAGNPVPQTPTPTTAPILQTPAPTQAPITPQPTQAPVTPEPTQAPVDAGKIPDAQIADFVRKNLNNPAVLKAAMAEYGISVDDIARATGYSVADINGYFAETPAPTQAPVTPAPTTAPLGAGGIPPEQIADFVRRNLNNPAALKAAMAQYGISLQDIANATGYSLDDINWYMSEVDAGRTPWNQPVPAPTTAPVTPAPTTAPVTPAPTSAPVDAGGIPDAQIADFVRLNINDPQKLINTALQYGVSLDDISRATGYSLPQIEGYLGQYQTGGTPTPTTAPVGGGTLATPAPTPRPGSFTDYTSMLTSPVWGTDYQPQQSNPYLDQIAGDITRRSGELMDRGIRAARGGAIQTGGFGGSGMQLAQNRVIEDTADNLQGNLANLYGQQYNQDAQRGLARYQADQGYALGKGGLANQRYGMDQGFFTQQRGQDLAQIGLGASLMGQGQQADWQPLLNANNMFTPYTGMGTTTTGGTQGGGWQGGLMGGLGGIKFGRDAGWW